MVLEKEWVLLTAEEYWELEEEKAEKYYPHNLKSMIYLQSIIRPQIVAFYSMQRIIFFFEGEMQSGIYWITEKESPISLCI